MSDITAFILMYLTEEDSFWMLIRLLSGQRYNLRGIFLPGFPMLHQHFYVHEQILNSRIPKLADHLKEKGLESAHYLTRWFLLVFINILPFSLVVRVWDLFFYYGYDIIFSVSFGILKLFEANLMKSQLDGIFQVFKNLETLEIEADEFIKFIIKNKIKSKELRKLEQEYAKKGQQNVTQKKSQKKGI